MVLEDPGGAGDGWTPWSRMSFPTQTIPWLCGSTVAPLPLPWGHPSHPPVPGTSLSPAPGCPHIPGAGSSPLHGRWPCPWPGVGLDDPRLVFWVLLLSQHPCPVFLAQGTAPGASGSAISAAFPSSLEIIPAFSAGLRWIFIDSCEMLHFPRKEILCSSEPSTRKEKAAGTIRSFLGNPEPRQAELY